MAPGKRAKTASPTPAKAAPATAGDGRTMRLVKQASLIVGLLSGAVGLLFVLVPGIRPGESGPPADQSARITGMVVNPHTTRGQYLDYSDQSKLGFTRKQLAVVGASAFARVEIVGYRGKTLTMERQVVDADGNVLGTASARDFTVTPPADRVTHRWWDWTPLPRRRGDYAIVIKVLDPSQKSAIACEEGAPFAGRRGTLGGKPPRLCEGEG
jgi:hypothetical protein